MERKSIHSFKSTHEKTQGPGIIIPDNRYLKHGAQQLKPNPPQIDIEMKREKRQDEAGTLL